MEITLTKLERSEVELAGALAPASLAPHRARAVVQLNREVKLDGFRPGHIPESVLISHLGEARILLATAEIALQKFYPDWLREHQVDAIGRPAITISKLAPGEPVEFKIRTAIYPQFALPDYKGLASAVEPETPGAVTDQEIAEIIKAHPTETAEQVREQLEKLKQRQAKEKHRLKIMEKILAAVEISLPPGLVEAEQDKMLMELRGQVEAMGLKFEEYLKHLKKEEGDLKKDWRSEAEKRLQTALALAAIAREEKINADAERVEREAAHLQQHYKDVPVERLRHHAAEVLLVEQVWRLLEEQK